MAFGRWLLGCVLCGGAIASHACLGVEYNKVDETSASGECRVSPEPCDEALSDDDENCCHQDRDCFGGECEEGFCGPVVLSSSPMNGDAYDLVVEEDDAFWTTGYGFNIQRVDVYEDPATPPQPLLTQSEIFATGSLTIDDGTVYFTQADGFEVRRVSVDGATASELVAYTENYAGGEGRITTDSGYVYWATSIGCPDGWEPDFNLCTQDGVPPGAIFRISMNAGGVTEPEWLGDALRPTGIAVGNDRVFFAQTAGSAPGVYWRAIADINGTPTLIQAADSYIADVRIHEDRLYWTDGLALKSTDLDGEEVRIATAAGGGGNQEGAKIAFDDTSVFWSVLNGEVFRTSIAGMEQPVRIATVMGTDVVVTGIAASCDSVLFLANSPAPGRLFRVTK